MTNIIELTLLAGCRASAALISQLIRMADRPRIGPPPSRFLRDNRLRGEIGLLPVDADGRPM